MYFTVLFIHEQISGKNDSKVKKKLAHKTFLAWEKQMFTTKLLFSQKKILHTYVHSHTYLYNSLIQTGSVFANHQNVFI